MVYTLELVYKKKKEKEKVVGVGYPEFKK